MVIVGPGNLYVQEAKHQLSATVGIDGFAGPSDLLVLLAAAAADRELTSPRWTAARPSTERAAWSSLRRRRPAHATRSRACRALVVERPTVGDAASRSSRSPARARRRLANALAPEHLQLIAAELARSLRGPLGRLSVRRCDSATAFGTTSPDPTTSCPRPGLHARLDALAPPFPPRMAEVRSARGRQNSPPPEPPIARAEGFEVHAESMEARVRENHGP